MQEPKQLFAENLKRLRKEVGMTQRELAEKIGYSEKAVSKWEAAPCLPSVETMMKIAELLGTSLDGLLASANNVSYCLGIDGGGTKTDFLLTDASGKVIQSLRTGACNPVDLGLERSQEVLRDGIRTICRGIPLSSVTMFAGIAGGGIRENTEALHTFFQEFHFAAFNNGSDMENLIAAGLGSGDGISLILGTGICSFAVKNGQKRRISGWGYLIDDGGSGFNLGREALLAVYNEYDGLGPKTLLTEMVAQKMGAAPIDCIPEIYRQGKRYIASFAEMVFRAQMQGDAVADGILRRNMAIVSKILDAAADYVGGDSVRTVLSGGLTNHWEILQPMLLEHLRAPERLNFSLLDQEPVCGAAYLARKMLNP